MNLNLYPYQYNFIADKIAHLLNVYHSVNDPKTVTSIQEAIREDILQTFPSTNSEITNSIEVLMNRKCSTAQAEKILKSFQSYVIPFEHPTKKQVERVFKKVKKLKTPFISDEVLLESTYIGWNDIASNRKYVIYYDSNHQLQGFYGDITQNTVKGFCAICNKQSNVTLFTRKTKATSDGRYTKKGDYICLDSTKCNQQLSAIQQFYQFLTKIEAQ